MTNQAIEQAAREITAAQGNGRDGVYLLDQSFVVEILRRHFSAPSEPSDELNGKTPWEFACGWYTEDEIERSIANRHKSGFARPSSEIPADIESRAFAEWLTDQYRLAMRKGIEIGQRSESVLGEPSDELPMVLGIVPQIRKVAGCESWVIDDGDPRGNRLCGDGQWRSYWKVRTVDICSWPSYEAAIAFLRECAAQAASEPQQAGERARIEHVGDLAKRYAKIIDDAKAALENIVCTKDPDRGVVLLSDDGPTHYDAEAQCLVYDHENFSPLGDALIALHDILSGSPPPSPAPAARQAEPTTEAR